VAKRAPSARSGPPWTASSNLRPSLEPGRFQRSWKLVGGQRHALVEWNEHEKRMGPGPHPSQPPGGRRAMLESDPASVKARAYECAKRLGAGGRVNPYPQATTLQRSRFSPDRDRRRGEPSSASGVVQARDYGAHDGGHRLRHSNGWWPSGGQRTNIRDADRFPKTSAFTDC